MAGGVRTTLQTCNFPLTRSALFGRDQRMQLCVHISNQSLFILPMTLLG